MSTKSLAVRAGTVVLNAVFAMSAAAQTVENPSSQISFPTHKISWTPAPTGGHADKFYVMWRPFDSGQITNFHPRQLGCFSGFYGPDKPYDAVNGYWYDDTFGNDAYAPVTNAKPVAGTLNSRPAVQFNGVYNVLQSGTQVSRQGGHTVFALLQTSANANTTDNIVMSSGTFPDSLAIMQSATEPTKIFTRSKGRNGRAQAFDTHGMPAIITERATSGSSPTVEFFGNMQLAFRAAGAYTPAGDARLSIGGQQGSASLSYNGTMLRAAYCNQPLDDYNMLRTWSWMAQNSNVSANIPVKLVYNPDMYASLTPEQLADCRLPGCEALTPEQNNYNCQLLGRPAGDVCTLNVTIPFKQNNGLVYGKYFVYAGNDAGLSDPSNTIKVPQNPSP